MAELSDRIGEIADELKDLYDKAMEGCPDEERINELELEKANLERASYPSSRGRGQGAYDVGDLRRYRVGGQVNTFLINLWMSRFLEFLGSFGFSFPLCCMLHIGCSGSGWRRNRTCRRLRCGGWSVLPLRRLRSVPRSCPCRGLRPARAGSGFGADAFLGSL